MLVVCKRKEQGFERILEKKSNEFHVIEEKRFKWEVSEIVRIQDFYKHLEITTHRDVVYQVNVYWKLRLNACKRKELGLECILDRKSDELGSIIWSCCITGKYA